MKKYTEDEQREIIQLACFVDGGTMADLNNLINWFESKLNIPAVINWVACTNNLPPINEKDEWDKLGKISIEVLTYSDYGMRFGKYSYTSNMWQINGVTSQNGVAVTHWSIIQPPCL